MKRSTAAVLLVLGVLVCELPDLALAQTTDAGTQLAPAIQPQRTRPRPRIIITPGHHFYRQCVDGYREVWAPYARGTVVMPYLHCWWVRG
jgi:hypothetical protein